ncbi:hypothetical protein ACOSP6_07110 [Tenacibaculum sp. MEBiC06402]|uniref:hypothetical protein n=1 Tax=unclassified Tenacibaculum TaxID=2635139 RepID=UPI003B995A04
MKLRNLLLTLFLVPHLTFSQNLEKIGKAPLFRLTGGIGVNSVYFNGNSNREPFTYFLSGNVNLNISDIYNIPFSFSYSNSKFQSNTPFTFNRLSMHPSYKWVTAHIGDVNVSFSPYTLNGHQFTGLGLDLTPKDKIKVSLMYGRLLKAREFDAENISSAASYRRMGYGFKTSYQLDKIRLGAIFFRASDDVASLKNPIPTENEVLPKDNTVISFDVDATLWEKLKFRGEIALSALTEDLRVNGTSDHFGAFLVSDNPTTQYYKAFNVNVDYQVSTGSIGLGYERIDPNYRTLGGYFFNNDLENITVNATQRIFKDKVTVSFNAGLQNDDLDNTKATQLSRLVMALNIAYNANDKISINGGYSSFQSFTNIKNQFDFINGVSQIEEQLDQDNFAQISQNANVNLNYKLKESEYNNQNLNVSFSFQDAENRIGEEQRSEDSSVFYNANSVYTINYPQADFGISGALNTSFSTLGIEKNVILGPTVSATKGFLEKKLKVNGSFGYNKSITNGISQGDVTNVRIGSRYVYQKKHNFSLNALLQLRNTTTVNNSSFTLTFGYNYSFGLFNSKDIKFRKRAKLKKQREENKKLVEKKVEKPRPAIKFVYKDSLYTGSIYEVDNKIKTLIKSDLFNHLPKAVLYELQKERIEIASERKNRVYKVKAIELLKKVYESNEAKTQYNKLLFESMNTLLEDVNRIDFSVEKAFIKNRKEIIKSPLWNLPEEQNKDFSKETRVRYRRKLNVYKKSLKKLLVHRWVLEELEKYNKIDAVNKGSDLLREFENSLGFEAYKMLKMKEKNQKIKLYLQHSIIKFLTNKSENYIDENQYELRYINQD